MRVFDRNLGPAPQGDMLITAVDSIPCGFKKAKPEGNGDHILTHSETGHHHVMKSQEVDFYHSANDPFIAYIDVKKPADLIHLRTNDTHETIQFPPGIYRINRQGEESPEGWRRVAD